MGRSRPSSLGRNLYTNTLTTGRAAELGRFLGLMELGGRVRGMGSSSIRRASRKRGAQQRSWSETKRLLERSIAVRDGAVVGSVRVNENAERRRPY